MCAICCVQCVLAMVHYCRLLGGLCVCPSGKKKIRYRYKVGLVCARYVRKSTPRRRPSPPPGPSPSSDLLIIHSTDHDHDHTHTTLQLQHRGRALYAIIRGGGGESCVMGARVRALHVKRSLLSSTSCPRPGGGNRATLHSLGQATPCPRPANHGTWTQQITGTGSGGTCSSALAQNGRPRSQFSILISLRRTAVHRRSVSPTRYSVAPVHAPLRLHNEPRLQH